MWQRVEATNKTSGERKTVDMNVFPASDILVYGRVWFPENMYHSHRVIPRKDDHAGRK